MTPLDLGFMFLAGMAGCKEGLSRDEDASPPAPPSDAGGEDFPDLPPSDASTDAAVPEISDAAPEEVIEELPEREGINDRWAVFSDCELTDLKIAGQKLYALCRGGKNRIVAAPLTSNLETAASEEVIFLEEEPLVLDDQQVTIFPQVLNIVEASTAIVTATSDFNGYTALFTIDLETGQVADRQATTSIDLRIHNDRFPLPSFPHGAFLLGSFLLLSFHTEDFLAPREEITGDFLLQFPWNGVEKRVDLPTAVPVDLLETPMLLPTDRVPTLFLRRADGQTAWLLNNGPPAGFDFLSLQESSEGEGESSETVVIDTLRHVPLGDMALTPQKTLAASPDGSRVLLASEQKLIVANPETAEIFSADLPQSPIQSLQWYSNGSVDRALVTDQSLMVHSFVLPPSANPTLGGHLEVFGAEAGSSALDLSETSGCRFYQGLLLDRGRSAIAKIECRVFDSL